MTTPTSDETRTRPLAGRTTLLAKLPRRCVMAQTEVRAPAYNPFSRYEVQVKDLVYRRDGAREYPVRIFQPRGEGPFPAVVEVHGGAWMRGDIYQNELLDTRVASSGVVVAAVDFRLSDEAPYPASMSDISYATRWLKAHA